MTGNDGVSAENSCGDIMKSGIHPVKFNSIYICQYTKQPKRNFMKDWIIFLSMVGMLCFWGNRNHIGDNLKQMYVYRDSSEAVANELYLMEAKLSKTVYKYLSGVILNPFKNKYMLEAPLDMTSIAECITKGCTQRDDKIRAVYKWITHHIQYDYNYEIYTPDECYIKRKGVCNAYASLMVKMLSTLGIPALKIEGETKGPDNRFYGMHSWVMAEKGDGSWLLCDPTWDTGGKNENNEYQHPTWEWYDCPPEIMIYTHLPNEKRFQLLKKPLTSKEFYALPFIRPTSATHNHIQAIVRHP